MVARRDLTADKVKTPTRVRLGRACKKKVVETSFLPKAKPAPRETLDLSSPGMDLWKSIWIEFGLGHGTSWTWDFFFSSPVDKQQIEDDCHAAWISLDSEKKKKWEQIANQC